MAYWLFNGFPPSVFLVLLTAGAKRTDDFEVAKTQKYILCVESSLSIQETQLKASVGSVGAV
jgi:hypothetical protein